MKTNRIARHLLVSRLALCTAVFGFACSATDDGGSSAGNQSVPRHEPGMLPAAGDGTSRFAEHETTGPGANPSARAAESRQLTDAEASRFAIGNLFGSWTPSYSD